MRSRCISILLILVFWSGIAAGADAYILRVRVIDDAGTPIEHADVYVFPDFPWPSTFGNQQGEYVFVLLESGEKTVFVTANGLLAAKSTTSCSDDGLCEPIEVVLPGSGLAVPTLSVSPSPEDLRRLDERLLAFGENGICSGTLPEGMLERYRILWERAFDPPVLATISISEGREIAATWTIFRHNSAERTITSREDRWLNVCEDLVARTEELDVCGDWLIWFKRMAEEGVWEQPYSIDSGITVDGSDWTVEARTREKCHVVSRTSPDPRSEFHAFALFAVQLAGPDLSYEEVY